MLLSAQSVADDAPFFCVDPLLAYISLLSKGQEGRIAVYGIVAMALVAVFAVAFLYALHRAVNVLAEPLTVLPAQSGWLPQEHALSRFHARWYPASIVFLAFDVEMLFMYPWAVVVAEEGMTAVVEMFLFLGALLIAVTWAWREGVFRWV